MRIGIDLPLMRIRLFAGSLVLAAAPALAALPPVERVRVPLSTCDAGAEPVCRATFADEAGVAAELLYASMGPAAVRFAFERAIRFDAENEPEAAELWRRIAATAAELAESRAPQPRNR